MKLTLLSFFFIIIISFFHFSHTTPQNFTSIFSFGDSLADTGNFLLSGALTFPSISQLPYGMTYFHHPTGRCSDGRLVVDFIAESQGLPLLQPYLAPNQNFRQGANFAVAGATAMNPAALIEMGISRYIWTNFSLTTQLQWFDKLKPSLCKTTQECSEYFKKSLFLVGEIGGNDYNYAFFSGKSAAEVTSLVPRVVSAIAETIEGLIERGAVNLVVPGNLPVGCSTAYLTLFATAEKEEYDGRNGCLKKLNAFARYHNEFLRMAMGELRRKHPNARIIYADYYGAAMRFAHAPRHFGFGMGALQTCCGGGGPYNFNVTARCGHPGSHACNDPSSYVSWDGIHLTEAAYHHIAAGLLKGSFTDLPLMT
ncbi:GDSL esterase/lipase At5g45910-like [Phalaenopsis equestris]|uniref:GDSL esterase/lipase At5g45910-like n=1 Tax=Phalaenopsis equestris TaxID=78828 RepID=UPI0009E2126F|nr:GDSL esterase/lipase At5g45910-like [Phalaenopsis equestris]